LLCEQEDETVQHTLVTCVFFREILFHVLALLGLQHSTPEASDSLSGVVASNGVVGPPSNIVPASTAGHPHGMVLMEASQHVPSREPLPSVPKIILDIKDNTKWYITGAKGLNIL
jgi:hypothetical protein